MRKCNDPSKNLSYYKSRLGQLLVKHANDSEGSPLVSMTKDPRVATYFAAFGSKNVALIETNRAVYNYKNKVTIPGGIPENEYVVSGKVLPNEVKGVVGTRALPHVLKSMGH